jgi:hypothetical protein
MKAVGDLLQLLEISKQLLLPLVHAQASRIGRFRSSQFSDQVNPDAGHERAREPELLCHFGQVSAPAELLCDSQPASLGS